MMDVQQTISALEWWLNHNKQNHYDVLDGNLKVAIESAVDNLKNNCVKHGHWVFANEWSEFYKIANLLHEKGKDASDGTIDSMYCSNCAKGFNLYDNADTDNFDFCPACGAKMNEEVS